MPGHVYNRCTGPQDLPAVPFTKMKKKRAECKSKFYLWCFSVAEFWNLSTQTAGVHAAGSKGDCSEMFLTARTGQLHLFLALTKAGLVVLCSLIDALMAGHPRFIFGTVCVLR